jgi:ectoine hydroxylase-related dioxygenase (phytanoyl-CoA dioxygenase family)
VDAGAESMTASLPDIAQDKVDFFRQNGAVLIPGLFHDWIDQIAAGIEINMAEPGPYAAENTVEDQSGRFFDDYCNWQRIAPFEQVIRNSSLAAAAARLMDSESVQFFHDHVLVKEPGTAKPTPWHQDAPYYFVEGDQTVSFWVPVDPVSDATVRFIAGSHHWPKMVLPTRWLSEEKFYGDTADYLPVPDPDGEPDSYNVLEWNMQPGDAVAFHYRTVHGARGNLSQHRRRAFSMRVVGDDARYITRPGPTSPPFPGHDMTDGQILREDWFPYLRR